MLRSTSKAHVLSLYKTLLRHYGPQAWWPAKTRWEMMIGAILTQNTSWTNVERAISALRDASALSASAIAALPRRKLQRLIRSSGYFRQKAHRLKLLAQRYLRDPRFIHDRNQLLAQHGIGPETADSILLYAAHEPYFVVDAYTHRLGGRLGWFKGKSYAAVQEFFHSRLPRQVPLYNEYHALIVRHAKEYCTGRAPRCPSCPLRRQCRYAKGHRHE